MPSIAEIIEQEEQELKDIIERRLEIADTIETLRKEARNLLKRQKVIEKSLPDKKAVLKMQSTYSSFI